MRPAYLEDLVSASPEPHWLLAIIKQHLDFVLRHLQNHKFDPVSPQIYCVISVFDLNQRAPFVWLQLDLAASRERSMGSSHP
jgi:hypothetical protein